MSNGDRQALELADVLRSTCDAISGRISPTSPELSRSWERARTIVEEFEPVPWFVRRLTSIVFSPQGAPLKSVPAGSVVGLGKLLCAAASDPILGAGRVVTDAREATVLLRGDEFAAAVVIHSVGKRVLSRNFDRVWMPILDQALVRAQLGLSLGRFNESFGSGRGILAGFASRIGLCILMCRGTQEEGNRTVEALMRNPNITEIGLEVYGCSPLHIGAFLLSLVGCGGNASLGFVAYSAEGVAAAPENQEQQLWLAMLHGIEAVRSGSLEQLTEAQWASLELEDRSRRLELEQVAHIIKRRGHSWQWLLA